MNNYRFVGVKQSQQLIDKFPQTHKTRDMFPQIDEVKCPDIIKL